MSNPIVVVAHLVATDKDARDKILNQLHVIVENTRNSEPEAVKYAVCLPDNTPPSTTQDDTSIYVYEEYITKAGYDKHMSSEPVVSLIDMARGANSPYNASATKIYHVSWSQNALLSRPDRLPSSAPKTENWDLRARVENPYFLWATITDPDTKDIETIEPYGAAVVDYATKNEPDTIFYGDARALNLETGQLTDSLTGESGGFICAVEVYASKAAAGAHLQDESVKNLTIEGHNLGSKFEIVPMVMQEGWLIRE